MGGLKRARRDRVWLGVCGGVAHTYGFSPRGVRVATAVVAVLIPRVSAVPSLVIYLILGLILPKSDEF